MQSVVSSTGDASHALKLCVVVRKKLQVYFWKNRDFIELHVSRLSVLNECRIKGFKGEIN